MKKYIIYRHTLNNKDYIGYTSQTLEERLEDHIKESIVDKSERHFHRAIRKYGVETITSVILDSATTKEEAKQKERHYIMELDTFKNGYNMTLGGDGGNTKEKYTEERMKEWKKTLSEKMTGMSNGNARPDITLDSIVEFVTKYVIENNLLNKNVLRKNIQLALKEELNASERVIFNRGIKNFSDLFVRVNKVLLDRGLAPVIYDPYYRSDDERKHLAKMASEYSWVTDGTTNKQVKKTELDKYLTKNKTYKKGRTL
jgi:group I intron endonuclease